MKSRVKYFQNSLKSIDVESDDLIADLYSAVEILDGEDDISDLFDPIFELIENNPEIEFGSPGPLVHLVERHYPEYVQRLIISIRTKPTPLTAWMINRILNTNLATETKNYYLDVLCTVASNELATEHTKQEAQHFYRLHTEPNS